MDSSAIGSRDWPTIRFATGIIIVAVCFFLIVFVVAAVAFADEPAPQGALTPAAFEKHVRYLASDELRGRLPGSEGSRKAAEHIVRHFQVAGLQPLQTDGNWFQEFSPTADTTARNILAVSPGTGDLRHEAILVTGHYDHIGVSASDKDDTTDIIFNGADDNASGVSIMLLVAQHFSREILSRHQNRRTVIFSSFDAEEKGLLGARHYVNHPVWPLDKTVAIINFDGGGRVRMKKVFASDAETNEVIAQVVRDSAARQNIEIETRFGGHGRSDHAVFAERGIPGVHFLSGAHNDYHQVTDDADRINFDGGAAIATIGSETLEKLATHSMPLKFRKLRLEFDVNFALNLARIVGIVPVVNAQEGRYPQILYVIPESIAAKQGLKSGDQVRALDGMEFGRVEDFIEILQNLKVHDGVTVSILRAGHSAELTIPADLIAQLTGPVSKPLNDGFYEVEFRYKATSIEIKSVFLAGEFNDWNPMGNVMDGPDADGEFIVRLKLTQGFHEYKFVEDGTEWKSDPLNAHRTGFYQNSVVWVGSPQLSQTPQKNGNEVE